MLSQLYRLSVVVKYAKAGHLGVPYRRDYPAVWPPNASLTPGRPGDKISPQSQVFLAQILFPRKQALGALGISPVGLYGLGVDR